MSTQYDQFSYDYDWLFSDFRTTGERHFNELAPFLSGYPSTVNILDCACGTGLLALALARHGYRVAGSDASQGMIDHARARAAQEGLDLPFKACRWQELPQNLPSEFNVVLCCGNSIGHCSGEHDMLASLRGMYDVTRPGGTLIIETRNWEKVLRDGARFTCFGPRERDGARCVPLYVWTFPKADGEAVLVDVVLPVERDGSVSLRTYQIEYHPFRAEELSGRAKASGFTRIETDFSTDKDEYRLVARKPD